MADIILDAKRLAEAQLTLETMFGPTYIKGLEERFDSLQTLPPSKYIDEIIKCEKANEINYNNTLPAIRTLRDNLMEVEEVAKILNTRDVEMTQDMGIENNVEAMETSGLVRM